MCKQLNLFNPNDKGESDSQCVGESHCVGESVGIRINRLGPRVSGVAGSVSQRGQVVNKSGSQAHHVICAPVKSQSIVADLTGHSMLVASTEECRKALSMTGICLATFKSTSSLSPSRH